MLFKCRSLFREHMNDIITRMQLIEITINSRTISRMRIYIKNIACLSLRFIIYIYFFLSNIGATISLLRNVRYSDAINLARFASGEIIMCYARSLPRVPPKSSETVLLLESRDMLRIATTPFSSP